MSDFVGVESSCVVCKKAPASAFPVSDGVLMVLCDDCIKTGKWMGWLENE